MGDPNQKCDLGSLPVPGGFCFSDRFSALSLATGTLDSFGNLIYVCADAAGYHCAGLIDLERADYLEPDHRCGAGDFRSSVRCADKAQKPPVDRAAVRSNPGSQPNHLKSSPRAVLVEWQDS